MGTVGTALDEAVRLLTHGHVENPRMEARLLLAHVLGWSAAQVFGRIGEEISPETHKAFLDAASRRSDDVPLAHITGKREFWSLDLMVSPATLIPRPDTEALIELAQDAYQHRQPPARILDLGTGSGCILFALLMCFPNATGRGIDISGEACRVATDNAKALGLDQRCEIVEASWMDGIEGSYDLIVSNPPYIASSDIKGLAPDVRDHEPLSALDGGEDGLDAYRQLLPQAAKALSSEGVLILEIGIAQSDDVSNLATSAGFDQGPSRRDLSGLERALSFCKKGVGINEATG